MQWARGSFRNAAERRWIFRAGRLTWEDAPHLIVAGCNEGHLPQLWETGSCPSNARTPWVTNAQRLARDVYLLELLLQSRSGHGRVDLILGGNARTAIPSAVACAVALPG